MSNFYPNCILFKPEKQKKCNLLSIHLFNSSVRGISQRVVLLCSLLFGYASLTTAQSVVTLHVYDEFNQAPVSRATIAVVKAADSSLIYHTRTNSQGKARLSMPGKPKAYLFLVTHYKFLEMGFFSLNTYNDTFFLFPKNKVLSQVNISTNKAITLTGDTISYVADSFKLKPNASVEDLLKKLPGIQIDKDGTIKAQGERVEKILVDGDDFFGQDASVATKNLDAKMVDKVEVIDSKSNKAKSTGVDDGEKVKVINLKLKEEAKKGFFGKLEAGATNTKRYLANGMINYFNKDVKTSAYLLTDNMNNFVSWNDRSDFGIGNNWQYDDDLDTWINKEGNYENDYGVIPRRIQGGAFYSQKLQDKTGKITTKYAYNNRKFDGNQISTNKTIYEGREQTAIQDHYVNSDNNQHKIATYFEKQLDSFQNLKIELEISNAKTEYYNLNTSKVLLDSVRINSNQVSINSNGEKPIINLEGNYELKFKKPGRFVGLTAAYNFSNNTSTGITNTNALFFNSDIDSFVSNTDFLLASKIRNNSIKGSVVYIEPLYKENLFVEFGVSGLNNQFVSTRNTFSKLPGGDDFSQLIDTLSNNYNYKANVFSEYAKVFYKKKKANVEMGLKIQQSILQQGIIDSASFGRNFNNFLPFFKFDWKYKRNSNFKFNFRTSIKAPSIDQIQPFRNNTNPLFITEGNKNLIPSTNYVFSIRNNFSQPIKKTNLWASATFKLIQDDIVSSLKIGSDGVRKQTYVQTNGNYNIDANLYYDFFMDKLGLGVSPGFTFRYGRGNSFTNDIENITKVTTYSPRVGLSKSIDSLVSFDVDLEFNYSQSTIENKFITKNNQYSWDITVENDWQLPWDMTLEAGLEWSIYPASSAFASQTSVALLSADLQKTILKNTTTVKLGVYDILNQNRAINRSFFNNNVYESVSDALTRYIMLTVSYRFKSKEKKESL